MKDRQRWSAEEDALLSDYVRQYGAQDWHLVSQRMNTPLHRDAKSCLERWKNYLKPGLKRGSLSDDEQRLVIRLQAAHGNKWKKIAAELPGRTAKRLGKWWEVYKEKQLRERKEGGVSRAVIDPIEERKYDTILESFAEKLVKERAAPAFLMAAGGGGGGGGGGAFLQSEPPVAPPPQMLPPWLSNSATNCTSQVVAARPPSPSVTLSLSSPTVAAPPATTSIPWLPPPPPPPGLIGGNVGENLLVVSELAECCRELEEGQRAWAAHRKEAAWRLKRVELQLESEKACKRREKIEEIEAKMKALREEQLAAVDRIEAEYREQLAALRRDAETKELKLAEQWAAKHVRLTKLIEHVGLGPRISEPSPH